MEAAWPARVPGRASTSASATSSPPQWCANYRTQKLFSRNSTRPTTRASPRSEPSSSPSRGYKPGPATGLGEVSRESFLRGQLVIVRTDFLGIVIGVEKQLRKQRRPHKERPFDEEYRNIIVCLLFSSKGNLQNLAEKFPRGVRIEYVKGHVGNPGNEEADRLARMATRTARERARSESPAPRPRSLSRSVPSASRSLQRRRDDAATTPLSVVESSSRALDECVGAPAEGRRGDDLAEEEGTEMKPRRIKTHSLSLALSHI